MRMILIWLPIVLLIAVLVFRSRPWVRLLAVALIALSMPIAAAGLLAPHRLARELLESPPSAEWDRGARDTRDAVYSVLPMLASSFFALGVLALVSDRKEPLKES